MSNPSPSSTQTAFTILRTARAASAIARALAHHAVADLALVSKHGPRTSLAVRETDLPGLLCSMDAGDQVVSAGRRLSITAAEHAWDVQCVDTEIHTACIDMARLFAT